MPSSQLHAPVAEWYRRAARDLPWRRPDATPWSVLVSELMLQQTPVSRVLPVHAEWLARWPQPADLAAEPAGEAVRAWGRLGYPRRALRLHEAAAVIVARHGGAVPAGHADLRALPGVGDYTAAAVAAFAFGQRHAVVDTNVRRVHARAVSGLARPAPSLTSAERALAESLVPDGPAPAALWAVAAMELGALVCTARDPRCDACPVRDLCAWRAGGRPPYDGPPRRAQAYAGTDRQARGRLLAVLREAEGPVPRAALEAVWTDGVQRERALAGLVTDGLAEQLPDGCLRLPGRPGGAAAADGTPPGP
jgi:A/G-specific adenine glycosylase